MTYLLHVLILVGLYGILAISLNLISGYAGFVSLCQAAFYGVGAYTTALMALRLHSPFLVNMACAVLLAGVFGFMVGLPSLRIRDDYFVMASFAFQMLIYHVLNNWISFTGGPMGLHAIPAPSLFGLRISSHFGFLVMVAVGCATIYWVAWRIVRSPFGRILMTVREDEVLAQANGKNITSAKIITFVIGAMMAAVAGSLYASYVSYIDPTSFGVLESILIISIVIIGGAGSLRGSLLGAALLIVVPELLRFVGLPNAFAGNVRQALYGLLLILVVMLRPQGLLGSFRFQKAESRK
jgi:branched-chain amino acid transport system permease protein